MFYCVNSWSYKGCIYLSVRWRYNYLRRAR